MLMNKFTTSFFGEKSAQDTGSFENGNSVETKKGVHDFMCTTSLMCKKQYINITEELNSKQRNQNSDIYFTENIPKTSKNAADVLECEFLHPCSIQLKDISNFKGRAVIVCSIVKIFSTISPNL